MARPLKNNADYFSHDNDMRDNPRIKALRAKHGLVGYAIYCMTLEVLTKADQFRIQVDELTMEILAGDFGIDVQELERIMSSFRRLKLFDQNEEYIECPALIERMQPLQDSRERKRRWIENIKGKKDAPLGVIDVHNPVLDANATSKVHKVKIKESKDKDKDKVDVDDACVRTHEPSPTPPPSSKIFEEKKIMAALTEKTADLLATEAEGSLSVERVENLRAAFAAEMQATGKVHESEVDLVRHFVAWVRKKRNFTGGAASNPGPSRKNGINDVTLEAETYKRKQIF